MFFTCWQAMAFVKVKEAVEVAVVAGLVAIGGMQGLIAGILLVGLFEVVQAVKELTRAVKDLQRLVGELRCFLKGLFSQAKLEAFMKAEVEFWLPAGVVPEAAPRAARGLRSL